MSIFFIIVGVALFVGGIILIFWQRAKIARSVATEGVVVELIPQSVRGKYILKRTNEGVKVEKKYLYRPSIRFKTEKENTILFSARIATRPAPYAVGQRVNVLYDPNNPHDAQINSFLYLWFYVLMLIFFGLFFVALGLLGLVMSGRL